jgi:hypothetical protein
MNRIHMTAVAAIVAGAVTVGGVALGHSRSPAGEPAGATPSSTHTVAKRAVQVDALQASVDRQLAGSGFAGSPSAQQGGRIGSVTAGAGHDEGDDHGGLEPGDDHGSDDDDSRSVSGMR